MHDENVHEAGATEEAPAAKVHAEIASVSDFGTIRRLLRISEDHLRHYRVLADPTGHDRAVAELDRIRDRAVEVYERGDDPRELMDQLVRFERTLYRAITRWRSDLDTTRT